MNTLTDYIYKISSRAIDDSLKEPLFLIRRRDKGYNIFGGRSGRLHGLLFFDKDEDEYLFYNIEGLFQKSLSLKGLGKYML